MKPLFIGYGEDGERITLTEKDLETHLHGIGATRTGKSKMIEWIARELIRTGQGFCLIDPHGFLYNDLLRWLAYAQRDREVVLFNPSYDRRVVGFNPFRSQTGDIGTLVDRRLKATLKVWGSTNANETPRLERWLRAFYHVLIEQGYSLDVARYLFTFRHKQIREYLAHSIRSELIRNEFEELSEYTKLREFMDQVESTKNRLFRFLAPQQVRRVVGLETNNINLEEIIERGQVLLINLQPSDTLDAEHARLIGTLFLNEFWEVARRRQQTATGANPSDFFLVIDEFQEFLTPDISTMLDQAAKYGIHLMLFHQRLSQLKELDPQAFGAINNAQLKLVYGGLSDEDAQLMVRAIFPGQIDLKRVKFLIEQTKFWPRVGRANVRSSSDTTGRSQGNMSGGSSGTVLGASSGVSLGPDWPGSHDITMFDGTSRSEISSSSDSSFDSTSESRTEGEVDVPFIYPEAFTEVSSLTAYSLEEQLWELASQLREQYQRHFMIRRPGKSTIAGVTPFVKPYKTDPEDVTIYIEKCLKGFLTPLEVDRALLNIHDRLRLAAGAVQEIDPTDSDNIWEKPLDKEGV